MKEKAWKSEQIVLHNFLRAMRVPESVLPHQVETTWEFSMVTSINIDLHKSFWDHIFVAWKVVKSGGDYGCWFGALQKWQNFKKISKQVLGEFLFILSMHFCHLKPGSRPRTSVADNTGAMAVQWCTRQITFWFLQHDRGWYPPFLRNKYISKFISYIAMKIKWGKPPRIIWD